MTSRHDDDQTARAQITLRLDRDLVARIDELAGNEGLDRTELARRLLSDGLAQHRLRAALADVAAGRRSTWDAADRAGVSLYEMLDRVAEEGIPYQMDPEVIERIRSGGGAPRDPGGRGGPGEARGPGGRRGSSGQPGPSGNAGANVRRNRNPAVEPTPSSLSAISLAQSSYRPARVRVLFVGESAPAGGTHFYLANSNLFRATREAFGRGLGVQRPPDGAAFLEWFRELGCWLVDIAERPVNRLPARERDAAVDAGVAPLAVTLREADPERIVVVLRRIAPGVRRAASLAGVDDRVIDVVPFPVRQWHPAYVDQVAAIIRDAIPPAVPGPLGLPAVAGALGLPGAPGLPVLFAPPGRGPGASAVATGGQAALAAREPAEPYGAPSLHDAMVEILGAGGASWIKASRIAREIAAQDLWRRPSDGGHPAASQVSARARKHPELFQVSDLGIRLRRATTGTPMVEAPRGG